MRKGWTTLPIHWLVGGGCLGTTVSYSKGILLVLLMPLSKGLAPMMLGRCTDYCQPSAATA